MIIYIYIYIYIKSRIIHICLCFDQTTYNLYKNYYNYRITFFLNFYSRNRLNQTNKVTCIILEILYANLYIRIVN